MTASLREGSVQTLESVGLFADGAAVKTDAVATAAHADAASTALTPAELAAVAKNLVARSI